MAFFFGKNQNAVLLSFFLLFERGAGAGAFEVNFRLSQTLFIN